MIIKKNCFVRGCCFCVLIAAAQLVNEPGPLYAASSQTAFATLNAVVDRLQTDDPANEGKVDQGLIVRVQKRGRMPVIVRLREETLPYGVLSDTATPKTQIIDGLQSRVLDDIFMGTSRDETQLHVKRFSMIPAMALQVDSRALEILMANPNVMDVIEDVPVPSTLMDSVPLIGAGPDGSFSTFTGQGQTVAVLDTGVDKTHPFLSGKVVSEACYSSNVPGDLEGSSLCPGGATESTAPDSALPCDCYDAACFHGTHVAGIAAGSGDSFSGVAKDASIIAIQVFTLFDSDIACQNAPPCIMSYPSDQIKALERVYELRNSYSIASVNMSLGGGYSAYPCETNELRPIIDSLREAGIATVIASGNSYTVDAISTPACIPGAVSVGSTTKEDEVSEFSNSAYYLSLLAPGDSITSSVPGAEYEPHPGTSMAAPHAAGAWAVLKQAKPDANFAELLGALQISGTPVIDTRPGAGNMVKPRIEVQKALDSLMETGAWLRWDDGFQVRAAGVRNGGTLTVASRWQSVDLPANKVITKIRIGIHDAPSDAVLYIWQGSDSASLEVVRSQPFAPAAWQLNEIILSRPYVIDASRELWFGWSAKHGPEQYPCAIDAETQADQKGDFVLSDEGWEHFSHPGDWVLHAYIEDTCSGDADCRDRKLCDTPSGACVACRSDTDCPEGEFCRPDTAACVECLSDEDCDEFCLNGVCDACRSDLDCSDGLFCNGEEFCSTENSSCVEGAPPCADTLICVEGVNSCAACVTHTDCDDGLYCNGIETCSLSICVNGEVPCDAGMVCNEESDICSECVEHDECPYGYRCRDGACEPAPGSWIWMGGSDTGDQAGVYGTRGIAHPDNMPGARWQSYSWTDNAGNLWLFGGAGFDSLGNMGGLNDLWLYDAVLKQWAWMGGATLCDQEGSYGISGMPDPDNIPGSRYRGFSWTDTSGNLWLFGGYGFGSAKVDGFLNDLWRYDPGANMWTWVSGADRAGQFGVYGALGVEDAAHVPGARYSGGSWMDASGNLWLFGGKGFAIDGGYGYLNDVWRYNLSTEKWAWMGGNVKASQEAEHGTQGTAAYENDPGGRCYGSFWTDALGKFWLFGGRGDLGLPGLANDLWRHDPVTGLWTWVDGPKTTESPGRYGDLGIPAMYNMPGARADASFWADISGNLWLFGGIFYGFFQDANEGIMNDLWLYDHSSGLWTWMSGSDKKDKTGVYGSQGIPGRKNVPGARLGAVSWADNAGTMWLFGGLFSQRDGPSFLMNDMWRYVPTECESDEECPEYCLYGVCVECEKDNQCGDAGYCVDAECIECRDRNDCSNGEICDAATGSCLPCTDDMDCDGGFCINGGCIECLGDEDCEAGFVCEESFCEPICPLYVQHKDIISEKLKKSQKSILKITGDAGFDLNGTIDIAPLQVIKTKVNEKKGLLKIKALVPAGLNPQTIWIRVGDCFGEVEIR